MPTTRKQRIVRTLTPKRIRKIQARWKRRTKKVTKARAKMRGVWHGDMVVNGRRPTRKATVPAQRRPTAAGPKPKRQQPAAQKQQPKPQCDGTCTNSDMDPDEARAQGLCGTCCGNKELITNWRGKHHHMRCSDCDASGLANVAALRARRRADRTSKGRPDQPTRTEAASKTGGWFGLSALFTTLFMTFGWAWAGLAGAGSAALGGAAYRHERKRGTSDHGDRAGRKATRQAAREAGCSAACMWSIKPAETCRCPCGGTTHGTAHKRKAAA